jgi:hypothetical protein
MSAHYRQTETAHILSGKRENWKIQRHNTGRLKYKKISEVRFDKG